jgi:hypothetical protein
MVPLGQHFFNVLSKELGTRTSPAPQQRSKSSKSVLLTGQHALIFRSATGTKMSPTPQQRFKPSRRVLQHRPRLSIPAEPTGQQLPLMSTSVVLAGQQRSPSNGCRTKMSPLPQQNPKESASVVLTGQQTLFWSGSGTRMSPTPQQRSKASTSMVFLRATNGIGGSERETLCVRDSKALADTTIVLVCFRGLGTRRSFDSHRDYRRCHDCQIGFMLGTTKIRLSITSRQAN